MKSGSGHSMSHTCSVVGALSPCLGLPEFSQVLVPLMLGTVQRGWMLFPGAEQALGAENRSYGALLAPSGCHKNGSSGLAFLMHLIL